MRVLFVPFPLPTHFLHQVQLAWAFRGLGHEVRIAAPYAGPDLLDAVARAGLTAVPAGAEFDVMAALAPFDRGHKEPDLPPEEFHRRYRARLDAYAKASEGLARDLLEFGRWWRPDLVVADPMVTVAPIVSESLGVPLVRQLFGADVMRLKGFPGSGAPVEGDVRDVWPVRLREIFDRFGVEVRADYAAHTVDPVPLSMELPELPAAATRRPIRYVPYNGPGVSPGWVAGERDRPRICLTWGTVSTALRGDGVSGVPGVVKALAGLDIEVVAALSAADRALVGEPPPGVLLAEPTPLHLFLPGCAGIVHHGGAGTLLTAAALGVPQAVFPHASDQAVNAAQLGETGAGVVIDSARADADGIEAADAGAFVTAVERLLNDAALRKAADALRDEIAAQPSPADVAAELVERAV